MANQPTHCKNCGLKLARVDLGAGGYDLVCPGHQAQTCSNPTFYSVRP